MEDYFDMQRIKDDYTEDIVLKIESLEKQGYSREDSIKITELGLKNFKNEILREVYLQLKETTNSLNSISSSITSLLYK